MATAKGAGNGEDPPRAGGATMPRGPAASGLALAAAAGLAFGAATVAGKWAVAGPMAKAALAAVAAALVLAPFLRRLRPDQGDRARLVAVCLLGGAAAPALLFAGLGRANAADAGLLLTLQVPATALLAFTVRRERLGPLGATGLALLCAAAIAVAAAGGQLDPGRASEPLGLLLVSLAAFAWGLDNVLSSDLVGRHRPVGIVAAKALAGAVLLPLAWLATDAAGPANAGSWLALGAIGVVGVAGATVVLYWSLARAGAARASAVMVPASAVAAASGGAVILGESLHWLHGVALALVGAGMALLSKDQRHG